MKRLKLLPLAAIALIGCLDGTGPRRPGRPNALISDGAHGTTHKFFFFLPPMVPKPTPTGTFDRFRSPAVEICQLAGDENSSCITTIATFTMTSGPGSVIRVVPADKHYIVNWHTNLFPALLPSPTIYRIQVFDQVSALLLGFADVQLADNGKEAKGLTSEQMIGLVDGRTLPIKFRIEFGAVDLCPGTPEPCARATVGPEGGPLVATDDDGVALAFADFPAGWTDTPREVEITQITGEFGPGEGPLEGAPEGVRQYPLFFEYSTFPPATPEEPFNLPVRIGVCNVGEKFGDAFHPPHRGTTALALGEVENTHPFIILDFAPTSDLLGGCVDVTPFPGGGGEEFGLNRLDGWQGLLARAGMLAANVLAPRALEAAVVVDGGMGGSTDFFSPVGTVDTASFADFTVHDLSVSPAAPTTDDALTVSATITNAGGSSAGPATVNLCLVQFTDGGSGSTCYQPETPTLAAGQSATFTQNFGTFPAGAWHVYASVDTFEVVPESNETNNSALGPEFTITVGAISFETSTDGSPTCASCALTDEFGGRGVVFSFSPIAETGECAAYTNAQLFLSSSVYDPVGGPTNHSATAAGQSGGGFCSGLVTMMFGGSPDTVRFRLRGNNGIAMYPVDAFDAAGNLIPETQIVRSEVSAYTSVAGFAFRQETVTIINAGGVSRVDLDMNGFIVLIDNLLILP